MFVIGSCQLKISCFVMSLCVGWFDSGSPVKLVEKYFLFFKQDVGGWNVWLQVQIECFPVRRETSISESAKLTTFNVSYKPSRLLQIITGKNFFYGHVTIHAETLQYNEVSRKTIHLESRILLQGCKLPFIPPFITMVSKNYLQLIILY